MDEYLQQAFKINALRIGRITNAGIVQIGVGGGYTPRVSTPVGYTMVGPTAVPLFKPAVPLQAPVCDM